MRSRTVWSWLVFAIIPAFAFGLAAACSSDSNGGGGSTTSSGKPDAAAGTPISGAVTLIGTDNKFDRTAMTIKANDQITLTFENKGTAIHNFHILNVQSTTGSDIATKLLNKDQQETLTFAIAKPGTYTFSCDVHPAEMKGKLTVQ